MKAPIVAVVGGGLAGRIAAVAALEKGAQIVLIEKSPDAPAFNNSVISGGVLHTMLRDPRTPPHELRALIERATEGHCAPEVADAWAENAARCVRWMEDHGAAIIQDGAAPYRAKTFAPVKPTVPGMNWRGYGGGAFLAHLNALLVSGGARIVQPAAAVALARAGNLWRLDIVAHGAREAVTANAVILADGGFQGDRDLVRTYIGPAHYVLRAAEGARGDGLRMGMANGAAVVNMEGFYGHLLVRDAMTREDVKPYPILDGLASVGIIVGADGHRLVDESVSGVYCTNAIAKAQDPLGCWLIFDDDAWRNVGVIGVTPPNPYLPSVGCAPLSADTLEGLAAQAGIDAPTLADEVAALLRDPAAANPPHRGALKMSAPPFHAFPLAPGVTFTFGGLRVNGAMQCLDEHGAAIAGLYAAGGAAGGLHGGPRAGYAGGLLEAAIFGLIAGERAGQAT